MDEQAPYLIVGLGNPSPRYTTTRHNVGALVVAELARRAQVPLDRGLIPIPGEKRGAPAWLAQSQLHSRSTDGRYPIEVSSPDATYPVMLVRPVSHMNSSGVVVAAMQAQLGIPSGQVIVIHDDLDLSPGRVAVKSGGTERGHNGLRSVSELLESNDYLRVRVGIGRPPAGESVARHVLGALSTPDLAGIRLAASAAQALLSEPAAEVQRQLNGLHRTDGRSTDDRVRPALPGLGSSGSPGSASRQRRAQR